MRNHSPQSDRRRAKTARRGVVTVLAAIFAIVMLGMVAFSVDIGYLLSVKEEMQRTADSAALAAVWDYADNLSEGADQYNSELAARNTALQYALNNAVGGSGPQIDLNTANTASGDLVFGYINDLYNPNATFDTTATDKFNAVKVLVRRDSQMNGLAPMFFGNIFGHSGQAMYSKATAGMIRDVRGFQVPHDGSNLDILPFALDLDTWNNWMNCPSSCDDDWHWNENTGTLSAGCDGKTEVNLYPQGTGSPGNRGTVDIGSSNNSTSDIARQILYGISPSDMAYHNNTLEFDAYGELKLNGDTGISAGVKDELAAIKGKPRCIPIFASVSGPGNNAEYVIVKWMGIRIVDVKLTGPMNKKRVTIQAAPLYGPGMIPSTTPGTSSYVYSPVVLLD